MVAIWSFTNACMKGFAINALVPSAEWWPKMESFICPSKCHHPHTNSLPSDKHRKQSWAFLDTPRRVTHRHLAVRFLKLKDIKAGTRILPTSCDSALAPYSKCTKGPCFGLLFSCIPELKTSRIRVSYHSRSQKFNYS